MKFDDKRSPERILRYFELLEWKKNECGDKTVEEVRDRLYQELQLIKEELYTVEHLTTENSRLLLSNQGEVDQVKSNISYVEETIIFLKRDIILARDNMTEHRKAFLVEKYSPPSNTSKYPNTLTLDLMGIFAQSFLGIREDIRALFLDVWQALITLKIPVLAQYSLSLLIVIIFASQFDYYANITFSLGLIALYLCFKFFSVFRKINKNHKSISKKREIFKEEAYKQKQTLELHISDLKKRSEVQEEYLAQQRIQEEELNDRVQAIHNDVVNLKRNQERLIEFQQDKSGKIENYEFQLEELLHLDELTKNWLGQEIEEQINKAMKKLRLIKRDYTGERAALISDPIRSLIGCTSRTLPGQLVNDEDEDSPRRKEILKRYADDAKSEDDYDGKRRRYGIYEFTVFFLCSDYFNYYKCYYNFVRGKTIDEEHSEYLYDSIVFTKVQEKSSITPSSNQVQVSSQRLTISTNDGKLISLQINESRGDKNLSSKLKKIDEAATEIRLKLRQREISRDSLIHGERTL